MDKIKKIVSLFLLALFVSYYVSTNFFIHTHSYDYGTITHSHPYTSGTHTHSSSAFQLINNLTNLLFVGGGAIFGLALLSVAKALFPLVGAKIFSPRHIGNLLRAPPAGA